MATHQPNMDALNKIAKKRKVMFWRMTLFVMCTLTNTSQIHRENILMVGIFIGVCFQKARGILHML